MIDELLRMPGLTLLPTPIDLVYRWVELLRRRPVSGAAVFDVQLAAAMLANGVRRIYTYNPADFECFDELDVLTP